VAFLFGAIMALLKMPSDYVYGLITLTNGSVDFTGSGTAWQLIGLAEGDLLIDVAGAPQFWALIAEITSNTAGKLTQPWAGPDLVGVAYRMRFTSDGTRSTAQAAMLRQDLGNGRVQAIATATGVSGVLEYLPGGGAQLVPKTDLVSGADYDVQVTDVPARAAYNAQAAGFAVLISNVGTAFGAENNGRSAITSRETATAGVWSSPAYVTGPIGLTPTVTASASTLAAGAAATATVTPISGGVNIALGVPAGRNNGFPYNWSTTVTDANPGNGLIRGNNSNLQLATMLFVSKTSAAGSAMAAFLLAMTNSTNPTTKGNLTLQRVSDGATADFQVTNVTDATNYVKIAVTGHSGATALTNNGAISFVFQRSGDKGQDGTGTGDVVGPPASVDSRMAEFSGPTGKVLKDSGVAVTTFAKSLLDDTNAPAARTTLLAFGVVRRQVFTGSGTYTPHPNMVLCESECVGAGGGSGGLVGNSGGHLASGAGGSGSVSKRILTAADIGVSKVVTVGVGGTAGAAGNNNGGAGGDSSVGTLCVGKGGGGGTGAQSAVNSGIGGTGGIAGTGDITIPGQSGSDGVAGAATNMSPLQSLGGSTIYGWAAGAKSYSNVGTSGSGYGSGANGAVQTASATNLAGAAGRPGIVIITEFCSQ
jgi:hypothetical protein